MSAIAGVFLRSGNTRPAREVAEMLEVMARRGPDGRRIWSSGPITLGHGALDATPEAAAEQQPFTDEGSGNSIVADVRLDNREELAAALGISRHELARVGDAEMIVRAYQRWGERCCERLLGSFAFAIWDAQRQRLFLARDHFGSRPLQYYVDHRLFAFASDARAIVGLPGVPRVVNRDRVFDFLVGSTEAVEVQATFYENVIRLIPAHSLSVDGTSIHSSEYWQLDEPPVLRLASSSEYCEAFLDVFSTAVRCRSRGRGDVGVMLSGGIDSGSISAVGVEHGLVDTYSAVLDESGDLETSLVEASIRCLPIRAQRITPNEVEALCGSFEREMRDLENLFDYSMTLPRALFGAAGHDAKRSVLTGTLADEVVGVGFGDALRLLINQGRIAEVLRNLGRGNLRQYHRGWSAVGLALWSAAEALPIEVLSPVRRKRRRRKLARSIDELGLRQSYAERERLLARMIADARVRTRDDGPGSVRARLFRGHYAAAALERYDRIAATASVEARTPFMDRRVVEFWLSVPVEDLVCEGWSKYLLRQSMVGRLPEGVVWNPIRRHLGSIFTDKWTASGANPPPAMSTSASRNGGVVDLRDLVANPEGNCDEGEMRARLAILRRWLS